MVAEHLGDRVVRLRRLGGQTQEGLAARSGVSVDVVRKLEQRRKHSARLPTLHALARGLGVEVTALLGDPPGVPSTGEVESPQLVALRRAMTPPMFSVPPVPESVAGLSSDALRAELAEGWTLYHGAGFDRVMELLPDLIARTRLVSAAGDVDQRAEGQALLGKTLQLAGHLAIRLGKTDIALAGLERAMTAAEASSDPLLPPMICNSVAWAYQRQNRLADASELALRAADSVQRGGPESATEWRVWGGLLMSAATSAARAGDYDQATDMMTTAERAAGRLSRLPAPTDGRLVSVFSRSSVRIERVRLAVQHGRPEEALTLARGMRVSGSTPPSWRTWLLLDVARARADLGDAVGAVRALESLRRFAPEWMRHHTLAVSIVLDLRAGPSHPPGLRRIADFLGLDA
ncbi:helix-turn-helix domain-containing protein [Streptomyces sp. NPDC127098]|uniref:helix-turn-helix domain-containing protein n=1 Tax=Streptomyces sp. NPDC127098 TaxID=3347137 RepID=UPI00364A3530